MSSINSVMKTNLFGQSSIWLFVSSIMLGVIAEALILFATPLIILDITGKASSAGLAFAVEWLPAVLIYPFAGVFADRFGGKRVFIYSSYIRAIILSITIGLVYWLPSMTVIILLINAALMSFLMAPNRMAVEKLVPQIASKDNLAVVQSAVQNSELIGWTLGPALAAYCTLFFDTPVILIISISAFVLSLLPIFFLKNLQETQGVDAADSQIKEGFIKEMKQGFSLLKNSKPISLLAILNCSINLAFAVSLASHPAIIKSDFGLDDGAYGVLNTISGLLGLLNLLLIPLVLKKLSIYRLGCIGLAMIISGLLITSGVMSFVPYVIGFVIASIGVTLFNVFNRTQRIKALPQEHIGKVMGPFYLVNLITMPIGGILVALFADEHGNQSIIFFTTLLLLIIGPLLIIYAQRAFEVVFKKMSLLTETN